MTGCYREGCGQGDPQSKKDDQPESDRAFVVIPVFLATLAFFLPARPSGWGVRFPFSEKMFFMGVTLSRREFEVKMVGLPRKCRCSEAIVD